MTCICSYHNLHDVFENSGCESSINNDLSFFEYINYACLTAFDLLGDVDMDSLHLVEFVSIQLTMKFAISRANSSETQQPHLSQGSVVVFIETTQATPLPSTHRRLADMEEQTLITVLTLKMEKKNETYLGVMSYDQVLYYVHRKS